MNRARIRTLKPEIWADEKVGELSRDTRLLLIGLVTMADDEGRLRAAPLLILGHVFPYDDDVTPTRLAKWLAEIERSGVILRYEFGHRPYIAFRHWRRHQRPNRAANSLLPAPPDHDVVRENALPQHDARTDDSVNDQGGDTDRVDPPAQALIGEPIRSVPILLTDDARAPAKQIAEILTVFRQCPRIFVDQVAVENIVVAYPKADAVLAARTVVTWTSDPAFRSTNGAKLLGDALAKQASQTTRTRRGATTMQDYQDLKGTLG